LCILTGIRLEGGAANLDPNEMAVELILDDNVPFAHGPPRCCRVTRSSQIGDEGLKRWSDIISPLTKFPEEKRRRTSGAAAKFREDVHQSPQRIWAVYKG
jgi:hypothetical protein